MFISVTGKPGSGKSAYAINYILDKGSDYHNIYANINGLKLNEKIKALNFNQLMKMVNKCKNIYDEQIENLGENPKENIIDEPIVSFLLNEGFIVENPLYREYVEDKRERELLEGLTRWYLDKVKPIYSVPQYKPTLILIDEAQNHLPSKDRVTGKDAKVDPVIAWWISYHRHLFMDVLLLSQTYQKIHTVYLRDIEYFLYAVPSDRQLFATNFQYRHHTQAPFFKTNLVETIKIKKKKEIFEMYDSGDKVRTKSIIKKYALLFIALAGLVVFMFSIVISMFSGDEETKKTEIIKTEIKNETENIKVVKTIVKEETEDYKDLTYIKLTCIGNQCQNKENNIKLDIDSFQDLLKNTQSKFLKTKVVSSKYGYVYFLASPDFLGLFKRGATDEKNNKGFTILN